MREGASTLTPDLHDLEQLLRLGSALLPGHVGSVDLEHVLQLRSDRRHRIEGVHRPLEHHRHLVPAEPLHRVDVQRVDVDVDTGHVVEGHAAAGDDGRGTQQALDAVRERRLAAAALAGEAEDLAALQLEVTFFTAATGGSTSYTTEKSRTVSRGSDMGCPSWGRALRQAQGPRWVAEPVEAPPWVAEPVEAPPWVAEPVEAPPWVAEPVEAPPWVAEPVEALVGEFQLGEDLHDVLLGRIGRGVRVLLGGPAHVVPGVELPSSGCAPSGMAGTCSTKISCSVVRAVVRSSSDDALA